MKIVVIGKPDCSLCKAAKAKLELLRVAYDTVDSDDVTNGVGMPLDDLITYRVALAWNVEHLPTLVIDGHPYSYSAAMAVLKKEEAKAND